MERRFYIGLGILITILCLGLLVSAVISGCQEPVADILAAAVTTTMFFRFFIWMLKNNRRETL